MIARRRDRAHEVERIQRAVAGQRRALDLHQQIDRHALGMLGQVRERVRAARRDRPGLAHPDDAAAADLDAGLAHALERVEPVLVGARCDDLAVELGRGVEVVVVVVEPGSFQPCGLSPVSMPSVTQVSSPSALHAFDHAQHRVDVAGPWASARRRPCRSGGPGVLCARAAARTASIAISFALEPGIVTGALRAVGAVLRAAARLDRQQRGELDLGRVEEQAMRRLSPKHQLGERKLEQRRDLCTGPVVAQRARGAGSAEAAARAMIIG